LVNTRASVDHDCKIGPHTHLGPGATLSGGVQVGRASHIGCGATIIENIHIGCGVMVAAGAVVIAPVPDNTIVRGVPARPSEADRR
jgi:UDP-perosamine 4-acetyltransferase